MGKLTDSQKIEMIEKYKTGDYNCQNLADYYGVTRPAIRELLITRKISTKKIVNKACTYTLNRKYFEKIDTEDKAYFLGLLYADGCNIKSGFTINLQERDRGILDKFNTSLGSNRPLKHIIKDGNRQKQYRLQIINKKMSDDLINLGCVPAKSKILTFPTLKQVPSYLLRHFIRGYFDGDGCISEYKTITSYRVFFSISSTLMFCEGLGNVIDQNFGFGYKIKSDKRCHDLFRQFFIIKKYEIKSFLDWIYKDSTVYLDRKYNKYKEIFYSISI